MADEERLEELEQKVDWTSVGLAINQGIADGIRNHESIITQDIRDFVKKEYEAVKKEFEIQSLSIDTYLKGGEQG